MVGAQGESPEVMVVGDEDVSESAAAYIDGILREDETPVAVSAFDDETRVLAITDQRILVADEQADEEGDGWSLVLDVDHDDVSLLARDGLTLIIETTKAGERRYRFGQDQTVEELVEIARGRQTGQAHVEDGARSSIADRVRFWEEQDRINQELIPRVIRQSELLTKHVAEHDSLPELAGNVISQALAEAREAYRQQYDAALDTAKKELQEEQQQQYDAALGAAKRGLADQARTSLDEALATMAEESRRMRNVFIGIAAGAVTACVAALIAGLLV